MQRRCVWSADLPWRFDGLVGDDGLMEELDGLGQEGSFGSGSRTSIQPAGMSLERALEIAIAVLDQKTSKADWFAAEEPYKMPRLF
jgi:hypothetical protein